MERRAEPTRLRAGQQLTCVECCPAGTGSLSTSLQRTVKSHSIVLPVDALSGLMMTLPRMLQSALDARFPDAPDAFHATWPVAPEQLEPTEV